MTWGSFGVIHITSLILGVGMIMGLYFLLKKFSAKAQTVVLGILSFAGVGAIVYNLLMWGSPLEYLPFHLCSMMIYFTVFLHFIKSETTRTKIKSFMVPAMLIGAAMALIIPTEGTDPTALRVWEYMVAHGVLVFYGLYLMAIEKVDLGFKAYLNNLLFLTATTLFAFIMNSILVDANANYFFLRKPPMDGLPVLNLNNGWGVYIISLAIVACTLIFLIQLPFIIKEQKAKKKDK